MDGRVCPSVAVTTLPNRSPVLHSSTSRATSTAFASSIAVGNSLSSTAGTVSTSATSGMDPLGNGDGVSLSSNTGKTSTALIHHHSPTATLGLHDQFAAPNTSPSQAPRKTSQTDCWKGTTRSRKEVSSSVRHSPTTQPTADSTRKSTARKRASWNRKAQGLLPQKAPR
jgi:hypothetical protein